MDNTQYHVNPQLFLSFNKDFVRELRNDLDYSLQDFGDLFNVGARTIQNWENGTSMPTDYYIAAMVRLREKMNQNNQGLENLSTAGRNDVGDILKKLLIAGGIFAILYWLFNDANNK